MTLALWDISDLWDFAIAHGEISERELQRLLEHFAGNPSDTDTAPKWWASSISDLAKALYQGQDSSFALHDALLEAGHTELAEHFREPYHPKGCWALDLILGKS
jgi:hypothetical protein